ncbi:MAG: TIGR03663 family protein [Chloroflexi bacterium]|nr:TIGR03663 family protein [Chloroflexota bacterium]
MTTSQSIRSPLANKRNLIEIGVYVALVAAAAVLRFWELDARAVHHDESLHAFYSWKFFKGEGYTHDPLMHGPFQFFGNWLVFKLFGDSEYTVRALYASTGAGLVLLPVFLRRELGRAGAILAAAMLAFSPSFLYFSRFSRGDIYVAVWSILLVTCLWRYVRTARLRHLYGAAAVLALSFATKETTFLFAVTMAAFFLLWRAPELLRAARNKFSLSAVSPPAACFLLIVSLALPLYAAGLSLFQRPLKLVLANSNAGAGPIGAPLEAKGMSVAIVTVLLLLEVALVIGIRWQGCRYLAMFGIFYAIYVALFTTSLTNLNGLGTGIWGSLSYWIVQHGLDRLAQPWFYYLLLLSVYEFLPLVLGVLGAIYFFRRKDVFAVFLVYWAAVSLFLYSVAGEKAPWLVVHITLPLILLGGKFAGDILPRLKRWTGVLSVAGLVLAVAFTIKVSWQANYQKADVPYHMLVYAGGSADLTPIMDRIEKLAAQGGQGKEVRITIDSPLSWPWVWYLRDYSRVDYPDIGSLGGAPQGQVVLVTVGNEAKMAPYLDRYAPGEKFHQTVWFPEEYKQWKPGELPKAARWWWDYFWNRKTDGPYYSTDGVAYFPK